MESYKTTLDNGLTLLGEKIEGVSSAAFSILVPFGSAFDPDSRLGLSNAFVELLTKGSAGLDAKAFSDQCERIGLQKSLSSGSEASSISGQLLGENLYAGLNLCRGMLLDPLLPSLELDSIKNLILQDIAAIEDEPASKVMEVLNESYYPYPFCRSSLGTKQSISDLKIEDVREFYSQRCCAEGAIISVAGNFIWEEFVDNCIKMFGSWEGANNRITFDQKFASSKDVFFEKDTKQVQIALSYPSIGVIDPDYYSGRVWVNILSGGMSGRLFVEVREKRGLVYRVGASHSNLRGRSSVTAVAGTTPENARECIEVMLRELKGGSEISQEELSRAKVDLKTKVIMQSESSAARAASLANDYWNLKRVRSIKEIKDSIDAVSVDSVVRYCSAYPVKDMTLVQLGKSKVDYSI